MAINKKGEIFRTQNPKCTTMNGVRYSVHRKGGFVVLKKIRISFVLM